MSRGVLAPWGIRGAASQRSREGAEQCWGWTPHPAGLAAHTLINILDAGKTGWVLMVVLLESFCRDLYHSVSV